MHNASSVLRVCIRNITGNRISRNREIIYQSIGFADANTQTSQFNILVGCQYSGSKKLSYNINMRFNLNEKRGKVDYRWRLGFRRRRNLRIHESRFFDKTRYTQMSVKPWITPRLSQHASKFNKSRLTNRNLKDRLNRELSERRLEVSIAWHLHAWSYMNPF